MNSQKAELSNGMAVNYNTYLKFYLRFCTEFSYQDFPLSEIVLNMFAQCLLRTVKPQTIKMVVSALKTM